MKEIVQKFVDLESAQAEIVRLNDELDLATSICHGMSTDIDAFSHRAKRAEAKLGRLSKITVKALDEADLDAETLSVILDVEEAKLEKSEARLAFMIRTCGRVSQGAVLNGPFVFRDPTDRIVFRAETALEAIDGAMEMENRLKEEST